MMGHSAAPCRALGSAIVLYKPCVLVRDPSLAEKNFGGVSFPHPRKHC